MDGTVASLAMSCLQTIADNIEWFCWKGGIKEEEVRKFTFFVGAFEHLTDSNVAELLKIFACPSRKGAHLRAVHLYRILHAGIQDLDLRSCAGLVDTALLKMLAKRQLRLRTANLSRLGRSVNSSSMCTLLQTCGGALRSLCVNKSWCVNDDVIASLADSCPQLQRLHLASCTAKHLTMKSVERLCNAPFAGHLLLLDLSCTLFQPKAYAQFLLQLPSLQSFNLDMITASASEVFACIPEGHQCSLLRELVISNTNADDSVIQRFPALCPNLRSLNIGGPGSSLTEDCLPALAKLSSLEELILPSDNFLASSDSLTGLCLSPRCWQSLRVLEVSFPRESPPLSLDLLSGYCCLLEKLTVWHVALHHNPQYDHPSSIIFPALHSLHLHGTTFAPIELEHVIIMPAYQLAHLLSSLPASLRCLSVTHSSDLADDVLVSFVRECCWTKNIESIDFKYSKDFSMDGLRVLMDSCSRLRRLCCTKCWSVTQQNVNELRRTAPSVIIEWN